jgi:hypothetical protein
MSDYEPLDYRLRCHTKRTDLPPDVLRDICEAYDLIHEGRQVSVTPTPRTDIAAMQGFIDNDFDGGLMPASVVSSKFSRKLEMEINQLRKERDEARQMICRLHFTSAELQHDFAKAKGWNCFKEDGK